MKAWHVEIPVLIREPDEREGHEPKQFAMAIRFDIAAETAARAAQILRERLDPTCSDP